MNGAPDPNPDYLVTVCNACGTASCWHGEMMCESAKTAGTRTVTASSLVAAGREHPDHFSRAKVAEVYGGIEPALGATPTVAEMTADLGKLTLPEVIFVKDCDCARRPRFRTKAGDPTCEECGKAWTRTYGPSNDAPPEVQIEIRAAELAYSPLYMNTDEEWSGWSSYDSVADDRLPPETDSNWAGWLSAAIEDHDQEHPRDGQRNAVLDLMSKGLA